MWQPYRAGEAAAPSPLYLPTLVGIALAVAPLALFPLAKIDPLMIVSDLRAEAVLIVLAYPGWVAATAVRSRSVGSVIVMAALVPALAVAALLLTGDRPAEIAGDLDAFIALAVPPAILGSAAYALIELSVGVIGRLDPARGTVTARSVMAALAGLAVSATLVGVIGWLAFGVVGFRLPG